MAEQGKATASGAPFSDLPEPDYDYLDITGEDEESTNCASKSVDKKKTLDEPTTTAPHYILGTLIVRVVAARDLEPAQKNGFGQILLGGGRPMGSSRRGSSAGSSNPYASVKFGGSTQRTSVVYDTVDPIWPRSETMFMDVSLPLSMVTYPDSNETAAATTESGSAPVAARTTTTEKLKSTAEPLSTDGPLSTPILTVALFHSDNNAAAGAYKKYPTKGGINHQTGDSDDLFLGMTEVDLTELLTGKQSSLDQWYPLAGISNKHQAKGGKIRLVCEYEATDPPPSPGDKVRFTRYCAPRDLYPVRPCGLYRVQEVNGDEVLLTYTTSEGWVCSFLAHVKMLLCEERHQGALELCQVELASFTERLAYSPLATTVAETVGRVPDDGIVSVGVDAIMGGRDLLTRWFHGGVHCAVGDVMFATNLDGRHNPDSILNLGLSPRPPEEDEEIIFDEQSEEGFSVGLSSTNAAMEALPNMPECPITGAPMRDPVVAADGHTYERSAIVRWLNTSDKSPLTGAILPHKNLVSNYVLLSSLQEAADAASALTKDEMT